MESKSAKWGAGGETRTAKTDPQQLLQQLIQALHNPLPGAGPPDPATVGLASQLQKQMMIDSSDSCKQASLRSVMDKIEHQKKEARRKMEQLEKLKSQIATLETEVDQHTTQVTTLEEQRAVILENIRETDAADKKEMGVDEEGPHCEEDPALPTGRNPQQIRFSIREWTGDLKNFSPQELQKITEMTVRENARRTNFSEFGNLDPSFLGHDPINPS